MAQSPLTKKELRLLYPPEPDGGAAARRLLSFWLEKGFPSSVFSYVSDYNECATLPIICHCLRCGIEVSVPLCEKRGVMTARCITSLSQLKRGNFGIWEPPCGAPVMSSPSVVIVPGLAFDPGGYRLGRGGGYYDRYLQSFHGETIGLCTQRRLFEQLPHDSWDIPVKAVCTGAGIEKTGQ